MEQRYTETKTEAWTEAWTETKTKMNLPYTAAIAYMIVAAKSMAIPYQIMFTFHIGTWSQSLYTYIYTLTCMGVVVD